MYERSGGSINVEERLANRGATTHVAKLENASNARERIGHIGRKSIAYREKRRIWVS